MEETLFYIILYYFILKLFLLPLQWYLSTTLINIWDSTFFCLKTSLYFMYTFYCFYSTLYVCWKFSFGIKAIHSQTLGKWGEKKKTAKNQHFQSYFTFSITTLSAGSQDEILLPRFSKCVTFFAVLRTQHSGGAAILRCRSSITGVPSFQTK